MARRLLKKGMTLINTTNRQKVIFGKLNEDGSATCFSSSREFVTIDKEDLDKNYVSEAERNRRAREKRAGQGW